MYYRAVIRFSAWSAAGEGPTEQSAIDAALLEGEFTVNSSKLRLAMYSVHPASIGPSEYAELYRSSLADYMDARA